MSINIKANAYSITTIDNEDIDANILVKEICIGKEDFHIEIGDYRTIEPIPYSVLEETLRNLISNWNQKQKEK